MAAFFNVLPIPLLEEEVRDSAGRVVPEVLVVKEVAEPAPVVGFAPAEGLVVRAGLVEVAKVAEGRAPAVSEATRLVRAGRAGLAVVAGFVAGFVVLVTGRSIAGLFISEVSPGISSRTAVSRAGKLGRDCFD